MFFDDTVSSLAFQASPDSQEDLVLIMSWDSWHGPWISAGCRRDRTCFQEQRQTIAAGACSVRESSLWAYVDRTVFFRHL